MIRTSLAALFLLAIASPVVHARTVKLDKDGLNAWVPDPWKVDSADGAITAVAPGSAASAIFLTQPIRDLDLAYKSVPAVMKAMLPTIQFGQPRRTTIANLNAIAITGIADLTTDEGSTKIETNIVVLITPGQRALYLITMVQAENAAAYDGAIKKILSGLTVTAAAAPADAKPATPKENPCWEMKGQPNGWARHEWNGASFLLPRGWTSTEGKNPDTDEAFLQIAGDDGAGIVLFTYAAARPDLAWQALAPQLAGYGLGDAASGEVVGQRALCARGAASDAVLFHRSGKALVMLARTGGNPAAMRGILGSMRWK